MYNQGFWRKNHELWVEVQKAEWADVILDKQRKEDLRKDVYSFFKSEAIYKELSIPWKVRGSCEPWKMWLTTLHCQRGIIMWGPPGKPPALVIIAKF